MPKTTVKTSLRAVGYTRRSTDKQEASIADQTTAIREYAEEKGYTITRWYTDDAISGDDTENRHGFQQMLADAQTKHDFETIICWDQSRFGRFSPQEAGHWTYLFSKVGVGLVTVDKGPIDWNDFTGWLTYSVNQHSKHDFLKQLSKDVTRGQLEAMKKGSWLGKPPYGYRVEGARKNKRLVIDNPGRVKVVQRIFREYVEEGRSMGDIARRLQDDHIIPPGGPKRPWRYDSVRCILENPAYTGDYASGRYGYGKYHTICGGEITKGHGGNGGVRNPKAQWTVRRDNHEAVIDHETFEKAQATLARGKEGRSRRTPEANPFLLSGLLRCGKCTCLMWGDTVKGRRFYRCGNWQTNGVTACEGTKVAEDVILKGIAEHLDDEFMSLDGVGLAWKADRGELQPSDMPKAFAAVKKLVAPPKQPAVSRKQMEKLVREIDSKLDKARENLILLDAKNIPHAQEKINQLETEREELQAELKKRPPTEADVNAETLEVLRSLYWLAVLFRSVAEEANDPNGNKREGAVLLGAGRSPILRRYIRHITGIVVHSQKAGKGTATRHVFEYGEVTFSGEGVNTRKQNLPTGLRRPSAAAVGRGVRFEQRVGWESNPLHAG